jgi:hypothetical protein
MAKNLQPASNSLELLQKAFLGLVPVTYILRVAVKIYYYRGSGHNIAELILLYVVPLVFFALIYAMKSQRQSRLARASQSVAATFIGVSLWDLYVEADYTLWHTGVDDVRLHAIVGACAFVVFIGIIYNLSRKKIW